MAAKSAPKGKAPAKKESAPKTTKAVEKKAPAKKPARKSK